MKQDIQTRDDLARIVTVFYQTLLTDPIVGFFFTDIVQLDLAQHIPKITDFWAFQLLGDKTYRGNVFAVHHQLHLKAALTADHFHRWVFLLHRTIDSLYTGPTAEAMKLKAAAIAAKMASALANGTAGS
ncbi:MAG TPA: group III truncated hemoglobin [Pseudomonadales bacterium]|nr:group III truncated hemoglobin [Pseudomonadales bacterium]